MSDRPEERGAGRTIAEADEDRSLDFEAITKKYYAKIYNLILRLVGNHEDAEDLTVETFYNAFRAWGRFRGDAKVSTWLHQIAVNNCKNRFKQKDRQREREPISLDDSIETDSGELSREVADWRAAPEQMVLSKEFAEQVRKAVEALPVEYRMVLLLEQEDHSYEEIARITNLSVPAVKTRLHRARIRVRQRLEPYYRGWSGRNS
ncbi:MAG: sigma-70 family RNA polymerase sigma factor [Capsulimonadales bacterium]|nr:sigma-70 family RNA polymerase sigma factor [Capsulimonadales bacterium]